MGGPNTWQIKDPAKTGGNGKKTGLKMLETNENDISTESYYKTFKKTKELISRISKSWLSHVDIDGLAGSRSPPPQATAEQYSGQAEQESTLSTVDDVGKVRPHSKRYLREYELREATDRLLSTAITEPEMESVNSQISEFSSIEDLNSPL